MKAFYCSLERLKRALDTSGYVDQDLELKRILSWVSSQIQNKTHRSFLPTRKVLYYDNPEDSQILDFGDYEILSVNGLSHVNGETFISDDKYFLTGVKGNHNTNVFNELHLSIDSGESFSFSGTPQKSVHVDVMTGYHPDYNDAWVDTGLSLVSTNASDARLLTFSGTSNTLGENDFYPAFEVGNLYRIGDYEMAVGMGASTGSTFIFKRGSNGTSQVTLSGSETLYRFEPDSEIVSAALRWATMRVAQQTSPYTGRIVTPFGGDFDIGETMPADVYNILEGKKKVRVRNRAIR